MTHTGSTSLTQSEEIHFAPFARKACHQVTGERVSSAHHDVRPGSAAGPWSAPFLKWVTPWQNIALLFIP
jgi:hypothetical protein